MDVNEANGLHCNNLPIYALFSVLESRSCSTLVAVDYRYCSDTLHCDNNRISYWYTCI